MIKRKILAGLLTVLVLALSAAPALAADSSVSAYSDSNKVAGLEQASGGGGGGGDTGSSGPAATQSDDSGGNMPFTGADLTVLAGAGGILLLVGFGLRRVTHGPNHA